MNPRYISTMAALAAVSIAFTAPADAARRHYQPTAQAGSKITQFCGDRVCPTYAESPGRPDKAPRTASQAHGYRAAASQERRQEREDRKASQRPSVRESALQVDKPQEYAQPRYPTDRLVARGGSHIVSGVSAECRPWYGLTCGCEVSLKVFGRVVNSPNLKQARVWGQVFRHTQPFVGAAVGRHSHVALITGGGPGAWELFDPNSGGRKNRIRTSDLSEFSWAVDPHSRSVDASTESYHAKVRHHRVRYASRR